MGPLINHMRLSLVDHLAWMKIKRCWIFDLWTSAVDDGLTSVVVDFT